MTRADGWRALRLSLTTKLVPQDPSCVWCRANICLPWVRVPRVQPTLQTKPDPYHTSTGF